MNVKVILSVTCFVSSYNEYDRISRHSTSRGPGCGEIDQTDDSQHWPWDWGPDIRPPVGRSSQCPGTGAENKAQMKYIAYSSDPKALKTSAVEEIIMQLMDYSINRIIVT